MPEDYAARLRYVYARFAVGDPEPMAAFLADDVVYHLPGKHLGGGKLCGRDEVFARSARAAAECEAPPRVELVDVVACDDLLVTFERFTARRRGRRLEQQVCVVWRVAGAQCVEMWSHFADQAECDRFWED
jgi:ketosteroid isomerase-like protein